MIKRKHIIYIISVIAVIIAFVLWKDKYNSNTPRDYDVIMKSGILNVVTEYNSISYYVNGDSLTGFHYEILKEYAKQKKLKLNIIPEMSYSKQIKGIVDGTYDILANSNAINSELKDSLLFTNPIVLNRQILVQKRKELVSDSIYVKSQLDLAHKKIGVVYGSPSIMRIRNLSNEIGDTIYINEIEKYGQEQLLSMVAHGDINYAVCDESIALNSIKNYPQLDISIPIGFTQFYSWAVNKSSTVLLDSLNVWLNTFKKSNKYKQLYNKYYNK